MTILIKLPIVIFSSFLLLLMLSVIPSLYVAAATAAATTLPAVVAPTNEQPKPGIIMIITFENGTTKAIRSDSTNLQTVAGGYFIADSSVKASQPIQSKSVSNTIVKQLVSVFVDVRIDDAEPVLPPIPVKEEGGACAALYTYNPETGQCELPPGTEQPSVEPEPAPQPEPEPEPAPEPDPGNGDQNDGGDNGNNDGEEGGSGDGSDGEGGGSDNSGGGDEGGETD